MITRVKNELSVVATIDTIQQADRFGILDAIFEHPTKKIQFRFLTEISDQNMKLAKAILRKKLINEINVKSRNTHFGERLQPQMVVRDKEELLLFISPNSGKMSFNQEETCLWTNCRTLVGSFSEVFEDSWLNAQETDKKLDEMQDANWSSIKSSKSIRTVIEAIESAQIEVLILTSAEGLCNFFKNMWLFRNLSQRGIPIKLMAPLISQNYEAMQELSRYCLVRHVSVHHYEAIVIDGANLFQSIGTHIETDKLAWNQQDQYSYTSESSEVRIANEKLHNIWEKAQPLSADTLEVILENIGPTFIPLGGNTREAIKKGGTYVVINEKPLTEIEVLNKILHGKKYLVEDASKDTNVIYKHWVSGHPSSFSVQVTRHDVLYFSHR